MTELATKLLGPANRASVVTACVTLVEDRVASRRGARGLMIRSTYSALQRLRPGFTRQVVERLLPEFCAAIEPIYAAFLESDAGDFSEFVAERRDPTVAALLEVSDRRISGVASSLLRASYRKLRPLAESEVAAVVPQLGRIVSSHLYRE